MTEENRTYITHLKAADIPWHRLTTAYGRGTDFPEHFAVLEQMRDLASVKESLYELTTNMEHQSTLWHATPFGMVFLSRILEKALAESGQNLSLIHIYSMGPASGWEKKCGSRWMWRLKRKRPGPVSLM